MRDKWHSDNRDLIKWSVLLLLARRFGADRIIQIVFLNPSDFAQIQIDGEPHQIPPEVLSHFRDLRNITGLSRQPQISVFDSAFRDRGDYLRAALSCVASFSKERCVVFLDSDTGLEPNGGGDSKHVLESEALAFWDALPQGSVFVFYQHETNKAGKPWIEDKRAQLGGAIGVPIAKLKVASGPKIAKVVVFFYASKA
jgi:hypothetical protein